jgi:uncharacterized protein (DUF2141 family)
LSGLFVVQSFTLTLTITGIKDVKGELVIGIYDNQKGWLKKGHEFYKKKVKVTSNEEIIVFKEIPPGEYAISMYHDVNEDNKCNRNLIGYPTEGIGFSNKAKISIKAPGFKKASFILSSDREETIELKTKK